MTNAPPPVVRSTRGWTFPALLALVLAGPATLFACNTILDNKPGQLDQGETNAAPATSPDPTGSASDVASTDPPTSDTTPTVSASASASTPAPSATPTCAPTERLCAGRCVADDDPHTGCSDPACTPCPAPAHATVTCRAGGCAVALCTPGWADCNGTEADGCETDLSLATSCGRCGAACPTIAGAIGACVAGLCTFTCSAGSHSCAGKCVADSDPSACGPLCLPCAAAPSTTATCRDGLCTLTCAPNYADCNAIAADGCEALLPIDPANCGACGNSCGARACIAGACAPAPAPAPDPAPAPGAR